MNIEKVQGTHNAKCNYAYSRADLCVLCGKELGTVCYRGKVVCEDCIDLIKTLY